MSNENAIPPIVTAFDRQHRALDLVHRAVSQGTELQRRSMKSFVDSLDAQRAAGERATGLVDSVFETSFLVANASVSGVPGAAPSFEEAEARFEAQRDALDELRDASWTLYSQSLEDGFDLYERYADVYEETVDSSFEAAKAGTDWMSDQMAGFSGARDAAVRVDVEAE